MGFVLKHFKPSKPNYWIIKSYQIVIKLINLYLKLSSSCSKATCRLLDIGPWHNGQKVICEDSKQTLHMGWPISHCDIGGVITSKQMGHSTNLVGSTANLFF